METADLSQQFTRDFNVGVFLLEMRCSYFNWTSLLLPGPASGAADCRASHPSVTINWEILTNISQNRGAVLADVAAQDRSRALSPRLVVVCVTKGRHLLATN